MIRGRSKSRTVAAFIYHARMLTFFLFWICGISYAGAQKSYFVVTAPNVLRFNHKETILVSVFGEEHFKIKTWLQIDGRKFSIEAVTVQNEGTPELSSILVTEDDLFEKKDDEKEENQPIPRYVTLYAETRLGTYSRKIPLSYDTGYILVQTSKPLYHPKDKVNVRALAMTESLRFAQGWNISMDLISPSGITFYRFHKTMGPDRFFEQESMTLPPQAELGLWTVKAYYEGQYKTQGKAHFKVQEYVLPTFGVTVDVDEKVILPDTKKVKITVTAKYVYNKPVKGKAVLKISCLDDDKNLTSLEYQPHIKLDKTGKGEYTVDVENITDAAGGFPDGQRLQISARAIEQVTLNEEIGAYENTLFSRNRFKFDFEKSKKIYHPGLKYDLWVTVSLANGNIPNVVQKLKVVSKVNNKTKESDKRGVTLIEFKTSNKEKNVPLDFKVSIKDETAPVFTVYPYMGEHQLRIDTSSKIEKPIIGITTNIEGNSASGIICLMLSRGKYIKHEYFEPSKEMSREIYQETLDDLAPVARLVGYYVNKADGKLVADSSSMSLTPKCHGEKLTLKHKGAQETPGTSSDLTIEGDPNMYVGLNVMDKALLLLDDDHVLRKSKIFDMMRSHDLGCGQGGGKNAEEVFRDAGLTVVTNANVDAGILEGIAKQCEDHSRRKRSLDCSSTSSVECCEVGESYANKEIMDNDKDDYELEIEADDICKDRTVFLSTLRNEDGTNRYSFSCLRSHYYKCVETILDHVKGNQIFGNSALDTSSDFLDALVNYNKDYTELTVRNDFKDSWLFKTVKLDKHGNKEELIGFPSSITDWMFQGIGISDTHGPCIADPINVTAFQDFFIQLELPYKATRLEYFEITATVFNYDKDDSIKTKVFIEGVRGLCTGVEPDRTHLIATFDLQQSDAQTVRIPILPLEARDSFNIRVTAFGVSGRSSLQQYDVVEKKLLVVNEGIEERETIQVCLDPMNTDDDNPKCLKNPRVKSNVVDGEQITEINLTLPDKALIETGSAFAYLASNEMDEPVRETISGIENMLRKPQGCGEQTMIYLGPTVYVKMYWEQTNQINTYRERQASSLIRDGVARELTYRKPDGSYAAWLTRPSSTWLTAFVAKVFCQADRIVDNSVKPAQDIVPTIKWLAKMVKEPKGNFYDPKPVIHREMIGQIKEDDPSLTAFVLITLSECNGHKVENTDRVKLRAMQYLERLPERDYKRNPYLLAITTYALSMAKSPKSRRFMRMLLANDNAVTRRSRRDKDRHRNRHGRFWGNPGGHPANADSVETTAYALLAMLKQHRIREAANVVKWLIDQRDAEGAFRTTQDTVIGLQALSEYTAATYTTDVELYVKLSSEGWEGKDLELSKENINLQEIVKGIPVSREKTLLVVKTKGRGTGRLVIDYRFNRKAAKHEKCSFNISDIEIEELNQLDINIGNQNFTRDCDVCGKCIGDNGGNKDKVIIDDPDVNEIPAIQAHIAKRAAGNEDKPPKKHCIRFSVGLLGTNDHGMSIIDIGLETGMTVVKKDLDKLKTDGVIDSYEMPTQKKGFVILYIDKIVKEPVKIIFRLEDNFEGDSSSRQPAAIKIYDYYHPENECTKFYGSGRKTGSPLECQGDGKTNKETCTCLQMVCPDPQESDKIMKKGRAKEKPVNQLVELVCDNQRANFAARVKVLRIDYDEDKGTQTVQVEVEKSLHKGRDDLSSGDELELEMRIFCNIEIKEGQMYYLITKDGVGEDLVKYHLSRTSLMVEYNDKGKMTKEEKQKFRKSDRGYLQQIMDVFERQIAKGCPE